MAVGKDIRTVADYLRMRDSERSGNGIAIEYRDRSISRAEYWGWVAKYKSYFQSIGVKKGTVIPICNLNTPEYEFIYIALLDLGAIVSTVSYSFFKSDIKRHTFDKGADTIIISAEYCNAELKKSFEAVIAIENIKRIIFTSSVTFSGQEENCDEKEVRSTIDSLDLPKFIEVVYPDQLSKQIGISPTNTVFGKQDLLDEPATYSNTGGTTTGIPKCAVHTHRAIISLLVSHEKENYPEFNLSEGDKSLLLIPISHITSQFYSMLIRRASGAAIIYEQAFDAIKFVDTIKVREINDVVAPFGIYLPLALSVTQKGQYANLMFPGCGGEPTPYNATKFVNARLEYAGAQPLIIGCGSTEMGSAIMASYGIDGRTNESGKLFCGVEAIIVNPYTGELAENGEKGILFVNAPWQMKGYLNDEEATERFFSYRDKEGKVFGSNGDIVSITREHKGKPVYSMHGRCTDFVYQHNNVYVAGYSDHKEKPDKDFSEGLFLFEIKEDILNVEGVLEAEVLVLPNNGDNMNVGRIVADVVLMPDADPVDVIYSIYNSDMATYPAGITILTNFARSPATDKREIVTLKDIREGYFVVSNSKIKKVSFELNAEPVYSDIADLSEIRAVAPPEPKPIKT
jgi:long-chain acyl-CoA synthetase